MKPDKFGNPIFEVKDIIDLLYAEQMGFLDKIVVEDSKETRTIKDTGLVPLTLHEDIRADVEEYDKICQSEWFIPEEYKNMDIEGFLVHVCPKENYQRLIEELQEFRARNMLPLLRVLKYIVDILRKNNVVWGVGRGSSVASYTLFLLGVHKIDSVKYKLDWQEFLR